MATNSNDDDKLKAVEKVLGEPAFAEFASNAWKIRSNLIIVSVISIALVFADLHIDPGSTVLGLKFQGLNDTVLTKRGGSGSLDSFCQFISGAWRMADYAAVRRVVRLSKYTPSGVWPSSA